MRTVLFLASLLNVALAAADGRASDDPLVPFRVLRSLQLVQDRIANGDKAALPLQDELMPLLEKTLRVNAARLGEDRRDLDAFVMYALSGGNNDLIRTMLPALKAHEVEARIATAVLLQRGGQGELAAKALETTDPDGFAGLTGAYLALYKSMLAGHGSERAALADLDRARLIAPGSLIEEAALRRQLALHAALADLDAVLATARTYFRRFLFSPFAEPLVEAFAAAAVDLGKAANADRIFALVDDLPEPQGNAVFRRMSRRAALIGNTEFLGRIAAHQAEAAPAAPVAEDHASRALYREIATLATVDPSTARQRLDAIDPDGLDAEERRLLVGARKVLAEVGRESAPAGSVAEAILEDRLTRGAQPASRRPSASNNDDIARFVSDVRARLDALDGPDKGKPR